MPQNRQIPTQDDVKQWLTERNNWGRWGADDQKGAINLITPDKRVRAAGLVRSGRSISLSREFPKTPGPGNPTPAQHFVQWFDRRGGGAAVDYYGIMYHGHVTTHVDALCHVWDTNGMWGGKKPQEVMTPSGARWGDVDNWKDGIITRGVLLDIPRLRNKPHVTIEEPVHGWDLEDAVAAQGVKIEPGDGLLVYSGREEYQRANPGASGYNPPSPGLHASCMPFIRDNDVALLGWDMLDAAPNDYGIPWGMHGVLFAYGVALMDNCLLEPLAQACAEENRWEFMLTVCPLRVPGGTGSPVNPIATF